MDKPFIIFDGNCGFCNKTIMYIAKNDKHNNFKYVSSLSNFGINLLSKHQIAGLEKSTIILVEKDYNIYSKSIAIRKVLLNIPFYKSLGYLMFCIPKKISDYVYDLISKNRKLIIQNNTCEIPNPEIRKKFNM